ncbi:MAG TPA: DedA family protein [Candidatus Binatia bacterium]|nr:DedA family protein [Candidatus Binatia bacterium]
MEWITEFLHTILHLDDALPQWVAMYGTWIYAILFLIIFCETGLVVTPFLPGDSLLFAIGAVATVAPESINVHLVVVLLIAAAVLGDGVNYSIGAALGDQIREGNRFIKKKHLDRTHAFYEKYGAKTIVLARFVPIVRTFAPFVAGIGRMTYAKFATYNVVGAIIWVASITYAGYGFGNVPFVQKNFEIVILGIIAVSVLPIVIEFVRARRAADELV